jgi:hypothetical protein
VNRKKLKRISKEKSGNQFTKDPVNKDAQKYNNMYNEMCRFQMCAICGTEGPIKGSSSVESCIERLQKSNIKEMYDSIVAKNNTVYDSKYGADMSFVFENGLLKDVKNICKKCTSQLPEVRKKKVISRPENSIEEPFAFDDLMEQYDSEEENNFDGNLWEQDDPEESVASNLESFPYVPTNALIRGLFTGTLPLELTNLTYVEQSMISLYSAISKITLVGGKHYHSKGAFTYTVVNDLASVSRQLPRMPSIEDIAVLRHKNADFKRDYKYRPNVVHKALIWLKENNHLYKDIDIIYPSVGWETIEEEININHVDLSDEECESHDNSNDEDFGLPTEVSTNPGKNV